MWLLYTGDNIWNGVFLLIVLVLQPFDIKTITVILDILEIRISYMFSH
jgi:hypothetical protein